MIFTKGNIHDFLASFLKKVHELGTIKAGIFFIALSEDTPVAASEEIELSIIYILNDIKGLLDKAAECLSPIKIR